MVSRDNVIETKTICSCGSGDTENQTTNYFANKCPNCGKEGSLQVETNDNYEVSNHLHVVGENDGTTAEVEEKPLKISCKECGSEYCGQDGYDLYGGNRQSLESVNPNDITEDSEDDELSEEEENEPSYMSGWEGLCDLLKPLDGLAMMVQRGDYVAVRKIEMPQSASLWAYEGINIVDDSVTITDYTPEIYNTFVIKWGESYENTLEFVFNRHKALFGERKCVLQAKKVQAKTETEEDEEENKNKSSGLLSGIGEWLLGFGEEEVKKQTKNISGSNTGDLTDASNATGEEEEEDNTEEVPITDRDEAIQFGMTQVGKAKRDDGHTIELKVIGSQNWMMGEWCHVKIPSFSEDSYMFISKCNFESSADGEYINTLTLVDYPPSLGKPSKKSTEEDNTEEDSERDTGNVVGDTAGNVVDNAVTGVAGEEAGNVAGNIAGAWVSAGTGGLGSVANKLSR